MTQIIADRFNKIASKVSNKKDYEQKKFILEGFQNIDFTRQEQISFTFKNYIIELINEVHGYEKDVKYIKKIFKTFNEINRVTV